MAKKIGRRGPPRAAKSSIKIPCGWKFCKNANSDCKNRPFKASVADIDRRQARQHRSTARQLRFCCKEHLNKCIHGPKKNAVAGREPLTTAQAIQLFHVLRSVAPWAAVMYLLAIFTGERAGAVCQSSADWFSGMNPEQGDPARIRIPRVNRKTTPRQIALLRDFAMLLWNWTTKTPLFGGPPDRPKQWPHAGQQLAFTSSRTRRTEKGPRKQLLFPGRRTGGTDQRAWGKPISEKAFFNTFLSAQAILRQQRATAHASGETHAFDDICLQRLTTHTCKKTSAT